MLIEMRTIAPSALCHRALFLQDSSRIWDEVLN